MRIGIEPRESCDRAEIREKRDSRKADSKLPASTMNRNATYFCGADAPSERGSQPRSLYFAKSLRSRARRPRKPKGLPHETLVKHGEK
jgi:hypothetical protein